MASALEFPELPDYEEMPPPQPIQQATADEASKEVLSTMVDLWEQSGGGAAVLLAGGSHDDEFTLNYIQLAYYIMRHTEAQHYLAAHPQISEELRRYTTYLLGTNSSIYWTLCDFDELLKQLGA
jgi:hypothetical protein